MTPNATDRACSSRMQATGATTRRPVHQHERTVSGLDFFGEVSDLAAGLGILVLPLAPFALPALALTALAATALLVPVAVGLVLAAPVLLARRWWRSRGRRSRDANAGWYGSEDRPRRYATGFDRSGVHHATQLDHVASEAARRPEAVR
jgi:hypothetical protein